MTKFLLIFILIISFLDASTKTIDKKIEKNKQILEKNKSKQEKADIQVKILAKQISNQNRELSKLEKVIDIVNNDIKKHQSQLEDAKKSLGNLQEDSKSLMKKREDNETNHKSYNR